jgi:hypothetical protein
LTQTAKVIAFNEEARLVGNWGLNVLVQWVGPTTGPVLPSSGAVRESISYADFVRDEEPMVAGQHLPVGKGESSAGGCALPPTVSQPGRAGR